MREGGRGGGNEDVRLDDSLLHGACHAAHHSCGLSCDAQGWHPAVLGDDSCFMCSP